MRSDARRSWVVRAVLALGLLGFIVGGLAHISFNVDILKLLPVHLRQVEGLSLFLREFARPDELMITVEAPTAEAAQAAADGIAQQLTARRDLAKSAIDRPPWETDPGQLSELLAYLALNRPPEAVRALADRLSAANAPVTLQATLEKLSDSISPQEIGLLSYDPYDLSGALVGPLLAQGQQSELASADGTFHVVFVQAARPFGNYNEAIAWVSAVRAATQKWEGRDGCQLGYTGEPAIVASISGSMQSDMQSSGLVTLLVIALIFWFCYRRLIPLLQLQAMLVLIFALTLAIAGWFFNQLTVIGVGSSAIMIGLSVDYGYFVYQRAQGFTGTVRELQRQCVRYITWTAGHDSGGVFLR